MKNMSFVSEVATESAVKIFAQGNYAGESVVLVRGEHAGVNDVKSVQVADFTQVVFYESADGDGKHLVVDKDCADLKLDFAAQLIEVVTYAKATKGQQTEKLSEGEYTISEVKNWDKLILPRGFYAVFAGNKTDEHTVRIFENEECPIDKAADDYEKVLLFTLGSSDIRINFGIKEELSDDELVSVAGGKHCGNNFVGSCDVACGQDTKPTTSVRTK